MIGRHRIARRLHAAFGHRQHIHTLAARSYTVRCSCNRTWTVRR